MTEAGKYEVGDLVRCVDADNLTSIEEGRVYEVDMAGTHVIGLKGVISVQYAWRFAHVERGTGFLDVSGNRAHTPTVITPRAVPEQAHDQAQSA